MSEQTFLVILSTILVVVIAVLLSFLSAVLWQLVKVLREVYGIVRKIHEGSDALGQDLAEVRQKIKQGVSMAAAGLGALRTRRHKKSSSEPNSSQE